jgi:hypothetical protein
VTIKGYTWRSTVGNRGGIQYIVVNAEARRKKQYGYPLYRFTHQISHVDRFDRFDCRRQNRL